MTTRQFLLLLFISSLWGSSFIFMKVLVPIFGPVLTSSLRLLFASVFLFIYYLYKNHKMQWKANLKVYLIIGALNSAIPFIFYAYAALHIDASLSVILNSTSPMFGALFGYLLLKNKLSILQMIGLLTGLVGVGIVTSITLFEGSTDIYLSIAACIGAALLYGFSGSWIKRNALHVDSKTLTLGTLLFGGLMLLPFSFFYEFSETIKIGHIGALIVFGIMCTSVPYLIYYKLIQDVGAMKALTVTYLMPVFGVIWALLYLGEVPGYNVYIGSVVILIGVFLVTYRKQKIV